MTTLPLQGRWEALVKGKLAFSLKQEHCILLLPLPKPSNVTESKRAGMPNLALADWKGRGEHRAERLLAYHCIIPATINSLCPVGE